MNSRNKIGITAVLAVLALPAAAMANAGTPLMWAGMLHLVFGNALIGILEGGLLAKLFRLRVGRTIVVLILANYFSAWLGMGLLGYLISSALPMELGNAWRFIWMMVAVTYVITLICEFPFIAFALRRDPHWFRKAVRGSLIVQTVSYVLLFGWYWIASPTSLYTKTNIVELSAMDLPSDVVVYFISARDGNVYQRALAGPGEVNVFDLGSTHGYDRLFIRPNAKNDERVDLMARLETEDYRHPKITTIGESFAPVEASAWEAEGVSSDPEMEILFGRRGAPRLGSARESEWSFWPNFWAGGGLRGTRATDQARAGFAIETPFVAWQVRNVTHLPTDKVLLQLGPDQICVYDPEKKQIALVTKGRGPVAVLDEKAASQPSSPRAD
jgi:hypothetical protein